MSGPTAVPQEPIAAERTYALVVGIESYHLGPRLPALSGAARDALRVAEWLTGTAGVPKDNVRLLLSPLERNRTGADVEPATRENVEDALFRDLPGCDGDLLWIYWSGHGFLDPTGQLLLPYADATTGQARHLNLTSALRWWQSDRVGGRRFRRLVAIGDSCRIDLGRAKELGFGSTDHGAGLRVPERRQFVLYAARPGESAKNRADLGAGQFTDTLLRHLEVRPLEQATRDLVGIARAVQADFAAMGADGTAWQEPQFEIGTDWTGSSLFGDHWSDDVPARTATGAPVLDQDAWTELGPILTGCRLPADTHEAYRWAFDVAGCTPPAEHRLPSRHLTEIVRDLDSRQGTSRAVPLALPFVRHLASRSRDADWAARAHAWVNRTGARLGAAAVPDPPARAAEPPALHIRLTPDGADTYWTQLWLFRDRFENVADAENPMRLTDVQALLCDHLMTHRSSPLGRIEFHVPYHLLDEPFETWEVPYGRRRRPTPLGSLYEVVLRCPEERTDLAEAPWHTKWEWFETHGGLHPQAVHDVRDDDVSAELAHTLRLDEPPVCVLAEVAQPLLGDALDAVLDGGIPIAVWRRPAPHDPAPPSIRAALKAQPPAGLDVTTLPAALRRARVERHPLALLWDHPGRIPERQTLSS
ncbi:VMAP-C domain-containing protein [Streptomyces sp. NPDC001595]|uniref:VMAP-C domain-containing protein n=1 Tax=Streptomyces sp. NPDC001532 TaxID=3154520 RepID=UPI0033332EFA